MTDDFNQLRPPNDFEDDSGDELDWLSDVPEQPGEKPGDRLGFTGELAWRQDVEGAFEEQQPGFADELDWQSEDQPEVEPGGENDLPDWLTPFAQGTPAPDEPPSEDVPPWLAGFGEEAVEEEAAPVGDVPPWLREDAEEIFGQSAAPEENQVSDGDIPPWLAGFEEETAAEAGKVPVVDWLMQPDETPDFDEDDLFGGLDEALGIAPAAEPQPPAGLDAYLVEEVVEDDFFDQPAEKEEPAIVEAAAAESEAEQADWLAGLDLTPEPAAEALDGWFAEAEFEQDVLADEPAEAGEVPDWLAEAAPAAEEGAPKDIFAELGLPSPETGYEFLDQPEGEWFAEEPSPGASPGWLEELGEVDLTQLEPEAAEPEAEPADADFLAELQQAAPTFDTGASALDDLESLLASYEAPAANTGDGALLDTRVDIDRLLSDEDLEQIAARRSARQRPEISPDAPEWLSEMGLSVGEVSAAAILRKQSQDERPLDELDERLLALHESGLELTAAPEETPPADLKSLLPGVTQFIPPAPIKTGATGIAGELALTPEQAGKVRLLRSLAAVDEETAGVRMPSAIDLTYETPSFADILAEEGEEETPLPEEAEPAPAARPTRRRVKVGRLVMALLITAAVVLPFVFGPLRVGDLPPQQFAPGSRQQIAFDRVDALRPGDLALVAAEYGPTGAAELDGLTEALLRHIQGRGARPVIVSTNALGLLHVQAIGQRLGGGPVLVRYLAGGVVGLRAFGGDAARFLATDINGRATNLDVDSLRDFALVVVIAERAEDLRAWAEQIAPLTGAPLVAASGFSAAPLVEPYTLSGSPGAVAGIRGLLVGYADAYTYHARLNALSPADVPPPAETETAEPTQTPIPPTAEATTAPEAAPESTKETPEAAETPESTEETPEAAETRESAEETPETPAAPELVIFGVVRADQAVNVREGPGRTFTPVASVRPREQVQIIGRSGDRLWLLIRLEDGREGWISSDLIEIAEPPTPTPERLDDPNAIVALVSDSLRWGVPEAPAQQAAPTPAPELRYGAERWYSMTLGLIVIIAVIALGTVGTILSSLFRRRRR